MKKLSAYAFIVLLLCTVLLPMGGCTPKADNIAFSKAYYTVRVGESVLPDVSVTPDIAYTLKTEFDGIAKIENGALKGVSRGITMVTAEAGGLRASVLVEVIASDGTSSQPGEGKHLVLYIIDEKSQNYYQNYVREGEKTPDLNLQKNGYDFHGWFEDKAYAIPFDFTKEITSAVKIYGKYQLVQGIKTALTYTKPVSGKVYVSGLRYPSVPYTDIEIPAETTVDGVTYVVAGIWRETLQNIKTLEKIAMPYVREIGDDALTGCTALKTVTANEALEAVGSGVLNGSRWLLNEQIRNIDGKYHGAQLGNCYLFALSAQKAVYLFDNSALTPKVTLFASGALESGTKIYVPTSLYNYYYSHKNLFDFKDKGLIIAY